MEYVLKQLSKPYIRPVKPTPVYRGTLTLGDPETYGSASLVIDVELIARTMKAKLKSFKKYSILAETANNIENKTYEVSQSRTYSITVDENVNEKVDVPQDELDRAYALGKTFIPISKQDVNVFSFETSPCLSIISFIGKEEVINDIKFWRYLSYSLINLFFIMRLVQTRADLIKCIYGCVQKR